jgi:O-acetylserine/cysteine efflux transporter
MTHLPPRHLAFLVLINLIWGFNLIVSRVGVAEFPPVFFTALRFSALAVCLAPWLRWHRGMMQGLLVAAALSGGVQFALLFLGVKLSPDVGSVAIATQLGVPFATLMSILVLGEVIRWRRTLGIVLAFAGVLLIAVRADMFQHRAGLALVAASAFVGALGLVAVKRVGTRLGALEMQAWLAFAALPVLWPLTAVLERGQWDAARTASPLAWGALAFTVVMSSLVAHSGYYWLVRRYPVTSVTPLTTLSPVFSVTFGVLLLGERLTAPLVTGGLLTLVGVTIIALREPSGARVGS